MTLDERQGVFFAVSATGTWYGKLIRRLTRSRFNHSFIIFYDPALHCKVAVQVDGNGVHIIPVERLLAEEKYTEIELFEYDADELEVYLPCLAKHVGASYDWKGIWGFLIKLLHWKLFRRSIPNPTENKGELFCSEMVAYFARTAGIPWFNSLDPASVDPKTLYKIMCRDSSKFRSVPISDITKG